MKTVFPWDLVVTFSIILIGLGWLFLAISILKPVMPDSDRIIALQVSTAFLTLTVLGLSLQVGVWAARKRTFRKYFGFYPPPDKDKTARQILQPQVTDIQVLWAQACQAAESAIQIIRTSTLGPAWDRYNEGQLLQATTQYIEWRHKSCIKLMRRFSVHYARIAKLADLAEFDAEMDWRKLVDAYPQTQDVPKKEILPEVASGGEPVI